MVNKPALDTLELGREVNTAILSILGLLQGYIMGLSLYAPVET